MNIKKMLKSNPLSKNLIGKIITARFCYQRIYRKSKDSKLFRYFKYIKIMFSHTFITASDPYKKIDKLLHKVKITMRNYANLFYSLDSSTIPVYLYNVMDNLTPDYSVLLLHSIDDQIRDSKEPFR